MDFRRVRNFMSVLQFVRPSVCPHGTIRLSVDGFSWNFNCIFF